MIIEVLRDFYRDESKELDSHLANKAWDKALDIFCFVMTDIYLTEIGGCRISAEIHSATDVSENIGSAKLNELMGLAYI